MEVGAYGFKAVNIKRLSSVEKVLSACHIMQVHAPTWPSIRLRLRRTSVLSRCFEYYLRLYFLKSFRSGETLVPVGVVEWCGHVRVAQLLKLFVHQVSERMRRE